MARHFAETTLDESRCQHHSQEDVAGRDRHSHAKNETCQRTKNQQQIWISASILKELAAEGIADTGDGKGTDDHADAGKNADKQRDRCACLDNQPDNGTPHANVAVAKNRCDKKQNGNVEWRFCLGIGRQKQDHQQRQAQNENPPRSQN